MIAMLEVPGWYSSYRDVQMFFQKLVVKTQQVSVHVITFLLSILLPKPGLPAASGCARNY